MRNGKILNLSLDTQKVRTKTKDLNKKNKRRSYLEDDSPKNQIQFYAPKKKPLSVKIIRDAKNDKEALSRIVSGSVFNDAEYMDLSFSGINIKKAAFIFTDLSGSDFSRSTLKGCDFTFANLENCNFSDTVIENCLFRHTNLKNTNFSGADIIFSDFTGAENVY